MWIDEIRMCSFEKTICVKNKTKREGAVLFVALFFISGHVFEEDNKLFANNAIEFIIWERYCAAKLIIRGV